MEASKEMKKIAVINDISGFGKCSLTAAIPIISAHKMQCCPLVTGVYSNQTGYESFKSADMTEHMQGFIDEWKKLGTSFDAIITGFIPNDKQGEIIKGFIDDFKKENTLVVVDPVMADNGEIYKGFDESRINAVKELAEKADIITPNISELCILCNEGFEDIKGEKAILKVERMAELYAKKNRCKIVVSGIEINDSEIATAVFDERNFKTIISKKHGESFSGTGDIFSSVVLGCLLRGDTVFEATETAADFVGMAIADTIKEPHDPLYGVNFEKFLNYLR